LATEIKRNYPELVDELTVNGTSNQLLEGSAAAGSSSSSSAAAAISFMPVPPAPQPPVLAMDSSELALDIMD
jgi:mevalonate pyrophosphate decarboxylase